VNRSNLVNLKTLRDLRDRSPRTAEQALQPARGLQQPGELRAAIAEDRCEPGYSTCGLKDELQNAGPTPLSSDV
jgi:hypothetical protein